MKQEVLRQMESFGDARAERMDQHFPMPSVKELPAGRTSALKRNDAKRLRPEILGSKASCLA